MRKLYFIYFLVIFLSSCSSDTSSKVVQSRETETFDKRIAFFRDSLNISKGQITPIIVTMPDYCGACNKSITEFINSQRHLTHLKVIIPIESSKTPNFKDTTFLIKYKQESIQKSRLFITTTKIYVFDGESILYESSVHDENLDVIRNDLKKYFSSGF